MLFTPVVPFISGVSDWWLAGSEIDLDFENGRYYEGTDGQDVTDYLSCSRASIGYAQTAAGALTQFTTNELRITDLGLLIEDARTNSGTRSQQFSHADWGQEGINSVTDNAAVAPDGTTTAASITPSTGNSQHEIYNAVAIGSGTVTFSCYVKAGTNNFAFLSARAAGGTNIFSFVINLTTGAITDTETTGSPSSPSSVVEALGNGWFRASITMGGGSQYLLVGLSNSATPTWNVNSLPTYAGTVTDTILVWGAQVEAGAFASSYIPTTTTAATRAQDVVTTAGSLGTVYQGADVSNVADIKFNFVPGATPYRIIGAAASRSDTPLFANFSDTSLGIYNETTGALTATLGSSLTFSGGVRVASAWSGATRSVVGGGGTVASDSSGRALVAPPALAREYGGANVPFVYFHRLTLWTTKLADATLQGFTAP